MPTAKEWNAQHPVGTRVRYFPRGKQPATGHSQSPNQFFDTKVRRPAYHLSSGALVVPLEGLTGATLAGNIEVLPTATATEQQSPAYGYAGMGP